MTAFLGALVLLGAAAFVYVGFRAANTIPFQHYYRLYARVGNAAGLNAHDQVRMGGEIVGQVLHPRLAGDTAELELQLYDSARPLRSDTRLTILPRSPLGTHYVEISPGRHGSPLPDGAVIPSGHARTETDLDRVLDMLDAPTRAHVRELLDELGVGLSGRGSDINTTLADAPRLLGELGQVSAAITARRQAARSLVVAADRLAATADPVRGAIRSSITRGNQVLQALGAEAVPLGQSIADGPATAGTLARDLPRVDPLITELGSLASASLPLLRAAPSALAQTNSLLSRLQPGLRGLGPPLQALGTSVAPVLTLLHALAPALPAADTALTVGSRLIGALDVRTCDVGQMLSNLAQMMAIGNRTGGALRFQFVAGTGLPAPHARTDPYPAPCRAGGER